MTSSNRRPRTIIWLGALALAATILVYPMLASAERINIRFSPNILNLASEGKVVTIHTDVPYETVATHTVYLSAVPINSWKADDRGNFVAKFLMDEVKNVPGLVVNEENVFQFIAETKTGEELWADASVKIINRG